MVIISVVTKKVVTEEAAESTIDAETMKEGSDVKETLRMIWLRIHTFRKGILITIAATITSREKARKVRATYFGTASNGCLANVKRPISTLCKST